MHPLEGRSYKPLILNHTPEEFQSDAEHGLKSEIDLGSIHSGQVTGILVSQEKITAIDFGNVCTISAKHL